MNSSITFFYEKNPIQFDWINGQLMANATLMGRPYGINPSDIFKTKSCRTYQDALCESKKYRNENLRNAIQGGSNQGSWIHQDLIIEFARRLSPAFSIWCNDRIAELLREGKTEIVKPKSQIEALLESVQMLAEQEKRVNAIESKIEVLEAKIITSPADYFSIAGFWSMQKSKIDVPGASRIGKIAAKICKENGYVICKVPDSRFGSVNTYPSDVLSIIYNQEKNLSNV